MAEIVAQKCSARRIALRRVQLLVNELIQINESADRLRVTLIAAGMDDNGDTINKLLDVAGPSSASHTITAEIITMISSNSANSIGWSYAAEA